MKNFFKTVLILSIVFLTAVPVHGAVSYKISTKSISLDAGVKKKITLYKNKKAVIGLWTSDDAAIAKVSSKGKVTAVAPGTTKVRVRYKGRTFTCKVTVNRYELNKTMANLEPKKTVKIKFQINGVTRTKKAVWKTTDKSIATIKNGVITAVAPGDCKIKAVYDHKTYSCMVHVYSYALSQSLVTMDPEETTDLSLIRDDLQEATGVMWTSSDPTIATVNSIGTVTAIDGGICNVTASYNSRIYQCTVKTNKSALMYLALVKNMAQDLQNNGFTYGTGKTTYEQSLAQTKQSDCAAFVSWTLQKMGMITSSKKFYYNNGLNNASVFENNPKCTLTYPNKKLSELELQEGDICCFQLNSTTGHTAIYAGKNEKGKFLWFTAGKDATETEKTGSRYVAAKCGPVEQSYYNNYNVKVLIHLNFNVD